jgi:hypothetical protein
MSVAWLLVAGTLAGRSASAQDEGPEPDLIYFILVDRFANGASDTGFNVDIDDPQGFHGGDLQGIIEHLDDLQEMGVQTLWISPLTMSQNDPAGPWGAYHGYWPIDHYRIDPRFGEFSDLKQLADALHDREMRLVLDMVYNHVGYASALPQTHPEWFHPTGDIIDWSDPVQRRTHRVHGLPDLDQTHPAVASYLGESTILWLEASGADGIRVDAIGHMNPEFIVQLRTLLGTADLKTWILGEDFQGNPTALQQTVRSAELDAVFDFPLYYALTDSICDGQDLGRLGSTLSLDRLYPSDTELVTFLDNHDLPRIASRCGSTPDGTELALHLLFSLRGTPAITYGTEAGLDGAEEPHNRADMPWDAEHGQRDLLAQLQKLRSLGPSSSRDRMLYLSQESMLLLREGQDSSLLLLVHLGSEELVMDWPSEISIPVKHSAVFQGGTFQEAPSTTPTSIQAGPRSISRWYMEGAQTTTRSEKTAVLEFEVVDPLLCTDSRVFILGAGPELGNWDPDQGLELSQTEEGAWIGQLDLPIDSIFAWHPVVRHGEGQTQWADGPDHYNLVGGEGPQREVITWSSKEECATQ